MNDLERAIQLAVEAHSGQSDKAGETYIRHPLRVMEQMDSERERIVAVLHDVVEDSDYTFDDIEEKFDAEICAAVDALTRRKDDGELYAEFVERAAKNPLARRVKIADLEDNMDLTRLTTETGSIVEKQTTYHRAWVRLQDQS